MSSNTYVVLRPFWMDGRVQEAGSALELSDQSLASSLLHAGKVAVAPPEPVAPPEQQAPGADRAPRAGKA